MASSELVFQKGLPANQEAERFVLGAILMDDSAFISVAGGLDADDFSLESHRRIFSRMLDLNSRAEKIDRVTLANELMRYNQLESVGGLTYLISLDDGLPQIYNLESYMRIVKEKSLLRRMIMSAQATIDKCLMGEEPADQILAATEESLLRLGEAQTTTTLVSPRQVIEGFEGGINAFLDPSKRIKGTTTGYLKLDELTGGFRPGELIILASRPAMGKTALALNIGQHVAMNPRGSRAVAVFSLEMSNESLLTRMICAQARVDQTKFREGYLNADERRRLQMGTAELVEIGRASCRERV